MLEIKHGNCSVELDAWGTVTDLGSKILEGECLAFGKMLHGTLDAPLSCAYFAVTRGKFVMTYPFTEHAVVVEGAVTLTDQTTGKSVTYTPGDGWFIESGTEVLWEVQSERFIKNYMAVT